MTKLYNCNVRLAGLVHHDVPKYAVTEKEIILLRTLHGADAVVMIKSVGEDARTDSQELQRLAGFYGAEVVERVFAYKMQDLTSIVEDVDDDEVTVEPLISAFTAPAATVAPIPAAATVEAKPAPDQTKTEAKPEKLVGAAALK